MDALEIERAHVRRPFDRRRRRADPRDRASASGWPASSCRRRWTKPDAYFRRLFALRKEILLRARPQRPMSRPTRCSSIRAVDRAEQREAAPARRRRTSRIFPQLEIADEPDRRHPGVRPHRRLWRASRRRPSSSAPRTISSRRPISPRNWRGSSPAPRSRSSRTAAIGFRRSSRASSTRRCCRSSIRTRPADARAAWRPRCHLSLHKRLRR